MPTVAKPIHDVWIGKSSREQKKATLEADHFVSESAQTGGSTPRQAEEAVAAQVPANSAVSKKHWIRRRWVVLLGFLGLILAACGAAYTVNKLSGADASAPVWLASSVPELRIGGEDDAATRFTNIPSIVVEDEHLFVAVAPENEIREFDAEGNHLRTLGGSGRGPGEFSMLYRIQFANDQLLAMDAQAMRTVVFDADGKEVRSLQHSLRNPDPGVRTGAPLAVFADGSVLVSQRYGADELAEAPEDITYGIYLVAPDGSGRRVAETSPVGANSFLRNGMALVAMDAAVPWNDLLAVNPADRFLVIVKRQPAESGKEATFTVERVNLDGAPRVTRAFTYEPHRIPSEEIDRQVVGGGAALARLSAFPGGAGLLRQMRESHDIPEYEPPVSGLVMGDEGTIWLRREGIGRETVTWWVLGEDLKQIAQVELPAGLDVRYASREMVIGVEKDGLDVPSIVRYRVDTGRPD